MKLSRCLKPFITDTVPGKCCKIVTVWRRYVRVAQPPVLLGSDQNFLSLQEGAKKQFSAGHTNCGVELGTLLLEAYEEDIVPPTVEAVQRIRSLLSAFPLKKATDEDVSPVDEALKFVLLAEKWLKHSGGSVDQIQELHKSLAYYMNAAMGWRCLGRVAPHIAVSGDVSLLYKVLKEAVEHGNPSEEDLFIMRTSLQLALTGGQSQGTLQMALDLVNDGYSSGTGRSMPNTPSIHFVKMFLKAVQLESRELAERLISKYGTVLKRDDAIKDLVSSILNNRLPDMTGMGPLAGLLGSMMGV